MRRKTEFDATKLTQVATNVSAMSVYVDAFPIEQVKFRFAEFKNANEFIDIYLSFEDTLRIVQDIKSSKIFKDMKAAQYPINISFGGTVRGDQVESRVISFGMQEDKIYINAQKGPGKTTHTGAIKPSAPPIKKVSVGMSIDSFKSTFLYIEAGINAYLPTLITKLVDTAEQRRTANN